MATSVLMASDQENPRIQGGSEETRPAENAKQSGRRRSKTTNNEANQRNKKQPQRGMGVAQLERLRLQERWKKMTNTTTTTTTTEINNPLQYHFPPLADPTVINNAHVMINGRDQLGLNQFLQRFGNGCGFNGLPRASGFGGVLTHHDQFLVDPYGVGAPNQGFRVGTSKELSSIPNMPFYSGHCNVCHKKKRVGENLGCNGVRDHSYTEIETPQINGCNIIGFNTQNINGGVQNVNQGVEVVAVHRNIGNHSGGGGTGGNVLMEYEFFPGKGGRSTFIEKLKFGSEASCVTTTTTTSTSTSGVDPSNSVDLSLKLSY